ncbi:ankyrin repeat domain protein [Nitzschia inconspicua]|uniref:Ankyrin repeat domain protein n=1 Tax=Nitzschia inconspicua TaxID=303405 RepID=A0A9K3PBA2_9STRA|nr:ankyrin repeat domain protein [Nitzschia inconspicua]
MSYTSLLFLLFAVSFYETSGDTGLNDVYYTAFDSASWAITSNELSPVLGKDKQTLYDGFIDGCNFAIFKGNKTEMEANSARECAFQDDYRLRMNREQPMSVYNYTKKGYDKIKAPQPLMDVILDFWNKNKEKAVTEWRDVNVYHNIWEAPPTIVHLNQARSGGSNELQDKIWKLVQPVLEEWTGQHLSPVSLYGIRLYHNNSILAPHVDRMPLITSAIIQVDQDVDVPWPLEVYGHDGKATNLTMQPGDMVLYESHSVIHGRPFPMEGNFYANFFVHFEVLGPLHGESNYDPDQKVPPYLVPGSKWEAEWKRMNPKGWNQLKQGKAAGMARKGELKELQALAKYNPRALEEADELGWTPFHESIRSGDLDVVKFFLSHGIDKDLLTNTGVSPLWIARYYLGDHHEVSQHLESIGAISVSPEQARQESEL